MLLTAFRRMFAAIILKITYDIDVTDADDEYLRLATDVVEKTTEAMLPGRFWIEFAPFLKHLPGWIPGAEFKKFVNDMNPKIEQMLNQPWDGVKRDIVRTLVITDKDHEILKHSFFSRRREKQETQLPPVYLVEYKKKSLTTNRRRKS